MKKSLFSIVLLSSLSMATAYGAASAAQDQGAQADVKSAAAQVASPKPQLSQHPVSIQIADAILTMPPDLCAIIYGYSRPSPIVCKNLLPNNTHLDSDDLSRHDVMRVHFGDVLKELEPGQEIDWASGLESWQIIPAARGPYEPYQRIFIGYFEGGFSRSKNYRLSEQELLWEGKGYCVRQDGRNGAIFEEFDPAKGPDAQAKPEPVVERPAKPKSVVPARLSLRRLNFSA